MSLQELRIPPSPADIRSLAAGDRVLLTGDVHTVRDAAHARLAGILREGGVPPFEIEGAVIYHAGPAPSAPGMVINSIGPTSSHRMDAYMPELYGLGLAGSIGKGPRSEAVRESIRRHRAVYLVAVGGAAASMAATVAACRTVAWPELGPEAVMRLSVVRMPLFVAIDSNGSDIFETGPARFRRGSA